MKRFHIILCLLCFSTLGSSMYEDVKEKFTTLLRKTSKNNNDTGIKTIAMMRLWRQANDTNDDKVLNNNSRLKTKFTGLKENNIGSRIGLQAHVGTEHPRLQRRINERVPYRRQYKYKDMISEDTDRESSSSFEMKQWRDEFNLDWVNKKMIAVKDKLNSTGAININMAGGRPWSIPCGDPNQHDLPWGTCTLPYECDGEFRIYRGDLNCGRNQFVCCALQATHHDLYQALDMSFIDTSFSTSSDERKKRYRGSKEYKHKKKVRELNRRRKRRFRLKRTIKKTIRKLARQIRKALNRAFRNATGDRRHKTKMLKLDIKKMKKKFYLDRQIAKNLHDFDVAKVDQDLKYKLAHVRDLNHNFLMNDTYREIILTHNSSALRMLLETYPELESITEKDMLLPVNSSKPTRRAGGRVVHKKKKRKIEDYLEYDVEYGALYY